VNFKDQLPYEEHHRHIRRFTKSTWTDAEDVTIRCWVMFCQYRHNLVKQQTDAQQFDAQQQDKRK
jgi:hypothetical protein